MGATYTPQNGLDYAKRMIANLPLDDTNINVRIVNFASNLIHNFAPWRWTLKTLADITVNNNTRDYAITDPGDLLYIVRAELHHPGDNAQVTPLEVVSNLPSKESLVKGEPKKIALTSATKLRLSPTPVDYASNPVLITFYKQTNTVLTSGNLTTSTNLLFPDEYFWIFEEAVLLRAYQFANDRRAGEVQTRSDGTRVYSGQWGAVMGALFELSEKEKPFEDSLGIDL